MKNPLHEVLSLTRSLRDTTRAKYGKAIDAFCASVGTDPSNWLPLAVEKFLKDQIDQGLVSRHVNNQLNALKTVSRRYHEMLGGMDFAKPIEPFPVDKTYRAANRRSLSLEEAKKLVSTCPIDGSPRDKRDRVIILLGLRGGLRRSEIAAVSWEDLQGNRLLVHGKGGYEEPVFLDRSILEAVVAWKAVALCKGSMFCDVKFRVDENKRPRISHEAVYKIITERAKQAGIGDLSPHTLRHSCATLMRMAGVPGWRVSKHLRHHSPMESIEGASMTDNYLHDLEAPKRPVSEDLELG